MEQEIYRIVGMHPRNMTIRVHVWSMLDDVTVPASDQDVTVGTAGKIITKVEGCIVRIIEQEQPLIMLHSKPIKRVLPRFAYLFGEGDIC